MKRKIMITMLAAILIFFNGIFAAAEGVEEIIVLDEKGIFSESSAGTGIWEQSGEAEEAQEKESEQEKDLETEKADGIISSVEVIEEDDLGVEQGGAGIAIASGIEINGTNFPNPMFRDYIGEELDEGYCIGINENGVEILESYIIEVKYAEKDALDSHCEEAMKQIEEKQYATGLAEDGMKKIYLYGIACYKKHCQVVCREYYS